MRLDFTKHDVLVLLACDSRKGIWASESYVRNSKTVRNAGQISTTASSHTLQLVALTNALRSISYVRASKLLQSAPQGTTRARVLVTALDTTFVEALEAMTKDNSTSKPLRAGKNFISLLVRQWGRFTFEIRPLDDGDYTGLTLLNWARRNVVDPKTVANTSAILRPTAVSDMR
jgi:hypothetical protein